VTTATIMLKRPALITHRWMIDSEWAVDSRAAGDVDLGDGALRRGASVTMRGVPPARPSFLTFTGRPELRRAPSPRRPRRPRSPARSGRRRPPRVGDGAVEAVAAAEVDRAGQLASYLGVVPSEDSSGQKRRLGSITKSGSRHARRVLVEAAWHYRHPPRRGKTLAARQDGQPAPVLALAWKAQQRLHRTWRRLDHQRGKRRTLVAVAVARELAGFCWAIARTD
jgi:Transposase IS116/IS110/IS902 family